MWANVGHVCHSCFCSSSSCHFVEEGRSFPAVHKCLDRGWASSSCCGLLTSIIHLYFDLFGPMQPHYRLAPSSWVTSCWVAGATQAVYCYFGWEPPPATPPLLSCVELLCCQGNKCWFVYSCLWQPVPAFCGCFNPMPWHFSPPCAFSWCRGQPLMLGGVSSLLSHNLARSPCYNFIIPKS